MLLGQNDNIFSKVHDTTSKADPFKTINNLCLQIWNLDNTSLKGNLLNGLRETFFIVHSIEFFYKQNPMYIVTYLDDESAK